MGVEHGFNPAASEIAENTVSEKISSMEKYLPLATLTVTAAFLTGCDVGQTLNIVGVETTKLLFSAAFSAYISSKIFGSNSFVTIGSGIIGAGTSYWLGTKLPYGEEVALGIEAFSSLLVTFPKILIPEYSRLENPGEPEPEPNEEDDQKRKPKV